MERVPRTQAAAHASSAHSAQQHSSAPAPGRQAAGYDSVGFLPQPPRVICLACSPMDRKVERASVSRLTCPGISSGAGGGLGVGEAKQGTRKKVDRQLRPGMPPISARIRNTGRDTSYCMLHVTVSRACLCRQSLICATWTRTCWSPGALLPDVIADFGGGCLSKVDQPRQSFFFSFFFLFAPFSPFSTKFGVHH